MNKRTKIIAMSLIGVAVMVIGMAGTVAADNSDVGQSAQTATCNGLGWGKGFGAGDGIEAVVSLTGLTAEEVRSQRQDGQSLAQIAATKGVTEDALVATIINTRESEVQVMVTSGKLTQEQADALLAQMQERIRLAVNRTTIGPPEWRGEGCGLNFGNQVRARQHFAAQNGTGQCQQSNCTGAGNGQMFRGTRGNR